MVDEGHRLKNSACKLNTELKAYKADARLLLTGELGLCERSALKGRPSENSVG